MLPLCGWLFKNLSPQALLLLFVVKCFASNGLLSSQSFAFFGVDLFLHLVCIAETKSQLLLSVIGMEAVGPIALKWFLRDLH